MTTTEIDLLCEALRWRVGYEDSNPDVGFGVSLESLLNDILRDCGMRLTSIEVATVLGVYQIKRYRIPR